MNDDVELKIEDLDNVLCSIPNEMVAQKISENVDLYRRQQIEALKKENL